MGSLGDRALQPHQRYPSDHMAKPHRRPRKPVSIERDVEITSVDTDMSIHPHDEIDTKLAYDSTLIVRGTMNESIKATHDVEFYIRPNTKRFSYLGEKAPAGEIVNTRPCITIAIRVPPDTFANIWTLALNGGLKHAHFMCGEPHLRMADVRNVMFSNKPIE